MKRLIVVMGLILCMTACGAAQQPASEYEVQPRADQTEALAANDALLEAYDWDGSPDTVDVMPKDYAGRFIDEDNVLTILTVAPLRDVLETYQEACGTKNIRLQQAEFSYYDLNQAMDALTEYNQTHDPALCYSWGIQDSTNQIEIVVSAAMEEEAKKLQAQHPCITYSVEEPELLPADHSEYQMDERISLQLDANTYAIDTERISCNVHNGSDQDMYYSNVLMLDVLLDGEWYSVPYRSDIAFTEELPVVTAGCAGEASEWLAGRNYAFISGTYRLGLSYCLGEYAPAQGKDFDHIVFVEFSLGE